MINYFYKITFPFVTALDNFHRHASTYRPNDSSIAISLPKKIQPEGWNKEKEWTFMLL